MNERDRHANNENQNAEEQDHELERDRELEALGLGIAPGLPGDDRSELVERAEIGAGQPRRGAPPPAPRPR